MAGQRTSWSLPYFHFKNYKFQTAASKTKKTNQFIVYVLILSNNWKYAKTVSVFLPLGGGLFALREPVSGK